MARRLPPELASFIDSLPKSSQNNSREIVRRTWERIEYLDPSTQAVIMEKYGVYLDPDHTPGIDDGEPPF